jgi:hypothetical protein
MKLAGKLLIAIGLCFVYGSAPDSWIIRGIAIGLVLNGLDWNYKSAKNKED